MSSQENSISRPVRILHFVLIAATLTIPLAWLGHEWLEARDDARLDAQLDLRRDLATSASQAATKSAPAREHHDPSRCNVCQALAAVRGHLLGTVDPFNLVLLRQVHEQAALLIVAVHSQRQVSPSHPRGPPISSTCLKRV